jgi:hypothetical protein
MGSIWGLWVADAVPLGLVKPGDGKGWKLGVFEPEEAKVGVTWPSDSIRETGGLVSFAASGNANASIAWSSTSMC